MKFLRHSKNFFLPILSTFFLMTSCQKKDSDLYLSPSGSINIEITDAPIDDPEIRNAYITLSGITFKDTNLLQEKSSIDLLAYQNGNTKDLGTFDLPAQTYDHLTVELDLQEDAFGNIPGCFVATQQGKKHNLYPSNSIHKTLTLPLQNLEVAPGAEVQLLLDFDLRKLIRYGASVSEIKYQFIDDRSMEDAIRVLEKDKTGSLRGTFLNESNQDYQIIVYVYESGTFNRSREIRTSETDLPNFFDAVSSSKLNSNGEFYLPFLTKGSYELIFSAHAKNAENEHMGLLQAGSSSGSSLDNIHIEPGNEVKLQGVLTELLPN